MTTDQPICPRCRGPVSSTSPAGECTACLARLALATAELPQSPTELQTHFVDLEVLELIGTGGMASVYKVRKPDLGRTAAMKVLLPELAADPDAAGRFLREAQAQARLTHPHIVGVYDLGRAAGVVFLLMEYVEGETLREYLRAGRATPRESLRIIGQICDALQYAHDHGIVHRDVKPENVLIDRAGNVKLVDFGLAKIGDEVITDSGDRLGTARYMAPEQWANTAGVDHRADIYSLGVLFYELLTGDLPTPQFTPPSVKVGADRRLDRVVSKSLREKPDERYQQAAELRSDVDQIAAPRRRWRRAAGVALIVGVLAAAVLLYPATTVPPAGPGEMVWGPPDNLGPGVNTGHREESPCVSADGLTLWFSSDRPGGTGGSDLYAAARGSTGEPFGDPVNLGPAVNSAAEEIDPCVAADGRTLAFVTTRTGPTEIWLCRRADAAAPWGEAAPAGPNLNPGFAVYRPWLSADGLTLTFVSKRPPQDAVWVARRPTAAEPFGEPVPFGAGSERLAIGGPSFSFDGKFMLFNRHNSRFAGDLLWFARLEDPADPYRHFSSFGPAVNSPHVDTNPVLTADGRAVFFASDRPGGQGGTDLWQTRRVPKVPTPAR